MQLTKKSKESKTHKRFNKAKKLLNKSPESYYWLGMLMADGSFSHKCITLISKDIDNLERFKCFLEIDNKIGLKESGASRVNICDVNTIQTLTKLHGIQKNKTYNPPKHLTFYNKNQFISFLIGFIDGDGCIYTRKKGRYLEQLISICVHYNWLPLFKTWNHILNKYTKLHKKNFSVNCKGFALLRFGDAQYINYLMNKVEELNLPVFKRKWGKLNKERLKEILNKKH